MTEALKAKWLDMGRQAEIESFYPFTAQPDTECEYCTEDDGSVCDDCRQSQEEAEVARIIDEREEIELHSDGFRGGKPAVNVKLYGLYQAERTLPDDSSRRAYDLASDTERELAWEDTGRSWWEEAREMADAYGLESKKIYQEGRSGGWLVYDIQPESLNLYELRVFAAFSAAIKRTLPSAVAEVAYQTVWQVRQRLESLKEEIESAAESWAEETGRDRSSREELAEALSAVIDRYLEEEAE